MDKIGKMTGLNPGSIPDDAKAPVSPRQPLTDQAQQAASTMRDATRSASGMPLYTNEEAAKAATKEGPVTTTTTGTTQT